MSETVVKPNIERYKKALQRYGKFPPHEVPEEDVVYPPHDSDEELSEMFYLYREHCEVLARIGRTRGMPPGPKKRRPVGRPKTKKPEVVEAPKVNKPTLAPFKILIPVPLASRIDAARGEASFNDAVVQLLGTAVDLLGS